MRAPCDSNSESEIALPSPAPASISTRWPCSAISRTPAGVIATRYSSGLISGGTPTIIARSRPHQLPRPQRQPELDPVVGTGKGAPGQRFDLAHPVTQRVAMAVDLAGGALPLTVLLDKGLQRAQQLAAVLIVAGFDRAEDAVAVELQRLVILNREQQGEGTAATPGRHLGLAAVFGERRRLQRAACLVERVAQLLRRGWGAGRGPYGAALLDQRPPCFGSEVDRVAVGGVNHGTEQLATAAGVRGDYGWTGVGGERPLQHRLGGRRIVEIEDQDPRLVPHSQPLGGAVGGRHRAAAGGGDRRHDLLQAALFEDQALEPPLHRDAALQHLVLLVDKAGESLLGDRDERRRIGNLEEREVAFLRLLEQRFRQFLVVEAGAEAEPGKVVFGEQADVGPLLGGALERDAGGQHQLAARQPRGRVRQLGDVDPAHRRLGRMGPGGKVEAEFVEQALDGEHRGAYLRTRSQASVSTPRSTSCISSNCSLSAVSGGASWITGSPRSSARQIKPRR